MIFRGLSLLLFFSFSLYDIEAQDHYRSYAEITRALKNLHSRFPSVTGLQSIAKTAGNKDIWVLRIGKEDTTNHPGLAVIGGVDGRYIISQELSCRFAENLLNGSDNDSIKHLLDSVVFYILPNVSPDAMTQYFAELKYPRNANARPTDDDRDGRLNEDPPEDMNHDGMITMVRIRDASGEWLPSEEDQRVMIKADKKKGENGKYMLISEGFDNDHDKKFNEDGEGGIVFNQNMTYQFNHFAPGSGDNPVSEPETRGVADFLYNHWNIFLVFSFGPDDNLSEPMKYVESESTAEIVTGIQETDVAVNEFVSKKYNELTGKKDHAVVRTTKGGFMQWAYFNYGRLSFSTPAFYLPENKKTYEKDSTNADTKEEYISEINFLEWADSVVKENYFVPWAPVQHPDFPDREAEVGGIVPYAMINPPFFMLDSISRTHTAFIIWLATLHPRVDIINRRTTDLGSRIFRIEATVYNGGILPALSGIGEKTRWLKLPKITLNIQKDQKLLSGKKITLLEELPGDGGTALTWLIQGEGEITLEAGAPQMGIKTLKVELK